MLEPSLVFWKKNQEQSFFSRLQIWCKLVDPVFLLSSDEEIRKARTRVGWNPNEKSEQDLYLTVSSVQADSGAVLPIIFRPPAYLPASLPLIAGSFLPHNSFKAALFWQFLLQSYNAGFNYANRNSSLEKRKGMSRERFWLITGTVIYTTFAASFPTYIANRFNATVANKQMVKYILPIPLSVILSYYNVRLIRKVEPRTGIRVFDSNGNNVGVSKAAADKAVRETAISRATLFGTSTLLPTILATFLQKTGIFRGNPVLGISFRLSSIIFVFSLMVPVSFSLYPQLGTIKKENLEEELQAAAVDGQLFYHRGL